MKNTNPAIDITNLTVSYNTFNAVNSISLQVYKSQLAVIVGPNGCGKSSLLKCIARLIAPTQGTIHVTGSNIWDLKPKDAARLIAMLPQSPTAPEGMTVSNLVEFGRHPYQSLFRQWSDADEEAVQAAMKNTGVADLADRPLDKLSGGQRQRAWLAMTLAQQSPVILLDEPTSALDLGHQIEALQLAKSLAENGRTVIIVLHDLMAAVRFADVLIAMKDGKLIAVGPPHEIVSTDLVKQLYGIDADIIPAPQDQTPVIIPKI